MHFLKTLFWVAVAVGVVLFSIGNWTPVTIALWGGLEADVKLPVLILASFLIGFLPMLVLHRARMWSMKRRLEGLERQGTIIHAPPPAAPAAAEPVPTAEERASPAS